MADSFSTTPPASSAVSPLTTQTQAPIQKQVIGASFGDKLNMFMGNATSLVSNGASTVFNAMGIKAGAAAANTLQQAGAQLGASGSSSPVQISTAIHGMSNSQAPNGSPAVALGPNATDNAVPKFGAGTGGSLNSNMTSLRSNSTGQPAFGAGAIGLDGSSGLSGSGLSSGGGTTSTSTTGSVGGAIGSASGGDSSGALLNATKQMQETQMSFNLQYLQLQSQMQSENRSYTAVSNIMKTKHDTVKNSISNVR